VLGHLRMAIESLALRPLRLGAWQLMLLLVLFLGCGEPHVVISVDEKVPPSFNFKGNGTVPFFVVLEIGDQDESGRTRYTTLWKITPNSTKAGTVPFGPITYGIVPTGWTQTVPRGSPPTLVEGRFYHAGGPEIEMPEGVLKFRIDGGRVVRTRSR
jgi:hypothetical protein